MNQVTLRLRRSRSLLQLWTDRDWGPSAKENSSVSFQDVHLNPEDYCSQVIDSAEMSNWDCCWQNFDKDSSDFWFAKKMVCLKDCGKMSGLRCRKDFLWHGRAKVCCLRCKWTGFVGWAWERLLEGRPFDVHWTDESNSCSSVFWSWDWPWACGNLIKRCGNYRIWAWEYLCLSACVRKLLLIIPQYWYLPFLQLLVLDLLEVCSWTHPQFHDRSSRRNCEYLSWHSNQKWFSLKLLSTYPTQKTQLLRTTHLWFLQNWPFEEWKHLWLCWCRFCWWQSSILLWTSSLPKLTSGGGWHRCCRVWECPWIHWWRKFLRLQYQVRCIFMRCRCSRFYWGRFLGGSDRLVNLSLQLQKRCTHSFPSFSCWFLLCGLESSLLSLKSLQSWFPWYHW